MSSVFWQCRDPHWLQIYSVTLGMQNTCTSHAWLIQYLQVKYTQTGDVCTHIKPANAYNTCLTNSACANSPFEHATISPGLYLTAALIIYLERLIKFSLDCVQMRAALHFTADYFHIEKRLTTSERCSWHVISLVPWIALQLHKLPLQRLPGGLNWSTQFDSRTHLLALLTADLPAQGSQWWAPSKHARPRIRAVEEWSVNQGMSSSLCMQEAVQWGQSLWKKLAFPTVKEDELTSGERPHTHTHRAYSSKTS